MAHTRTRTHTHTHTQNVKIFVKDSAQGANGYQYILHCAHIRVKTSEHHFSSTSVTIHNLQDSVCYYVAIKEREVVTYTAIFVFLWDRKFNLEIETDMIGELLE